MKYEIDLNDRAFEAIINRMKRIEIRANTDDNNFDYMKNGDLIEFTNSTNRKIDV